MFYLRSVCYRLVGNGSSRRWTAILATGPVYLASLLMNGLVYSPTYTNSVGILGSGLQTRAVTISLYGVMESSRDRTSELDRAVNLSC
jgi:hypothetical protein